MRCHRDVASSIVTVVDPAWQLILPIWPHSYFALIYAHWSTDKQMTIVVPANLLPFCAWFNSSGGWTSNEFGNIVTIMRLEFTKCLIFPLDEGSPNVWSNAWHILSYSMCSECLVLCWHFDIYFANFVTLARSPVFSSKLTTWSEIILAHHLVEDRSRTSASLQCLARQCLHHQ